MTQRFINFKSDFKVYERFQDGTSVASAPFRFTYYISMNSKYVAEFDGSEFTNCHLSEDGQLVIPFENHNLGIGEIMVDREYFLNDTDFKDGKCNLVSTERTHIVLHNGATDDLGKIEVALQPYYHVVNGGGQLPDLSEYAKRDEIPTKTSQLVNDSGYVTREEVTEAINASIVSTINANY